MCTEDYSIVISTEASRFFAGSEMEKSTYTDFSTSLRSARNDDLLRAVPVIRNAFLSKKIVLPECRII